MKNIKVMIYDKIYEKLWFMIKFMKSYDLW
jgi:hypothetical protein